MSGEAFKIVLASPPEYQELVAEIYFKDLFFALISQERGIGLFDIETPEQNVLESSVTHKVGTADFLKAVDSACKRLRGENLE